MQDAATKTETDPAIRIERALQVARELCETARRTGMSGTVGIEINFQHGAPTIIRRITNATEK